MEIKIGAVSSYYFRKQGGLNFLLKCNYDTKLFPQLPAFYKNILKSFQELKILYGYDQASDLVLYNNKEIQVDQKTVYLSKWMEKGIVSVKDLLKEDGSYLSFREFKGKFSCNTNFIQYFQIISAIPNRLRLKGRQIESLNNQFFTSNGHLFHFKRNFTLNLATIFSLIKPTTEVKPVLKDGAKYSLSMTNMGQRYLRRHKDFAKKQN